MVEHPKSKSTQPSRSPDAPDCIMYVGLYLGYYFFGGRMTDSLHFLQPCALQRTAEKRPEKRSASAMTIKKDREERSERERQGQL